MIDSDLYFYKQPHLDNPVVTTTGFYTSFDEAFKSLVSDVEDFFSGTDIETAVENFGLEFESRVNYARASFEDFEWRAGQVA